MTRLLRASCWLAAIALVACAEERAPINRVQPLALKKTFFVGADLKDPKDNPEFWSQATLVDVGYGASQDGLFTSTYAQPLARIRWQITQDLLIGRLAYERIVGSDGKGAGKATQDGVIACAFRIESHFDIRNAYNSTTGEELNVREENSSDRPWYEREYMRVDWSRNLNTDSYDFDTLSMLGIYGGVVYEPLAFDIEDPNDDNAPYFAKAGDYFDITSKAFARPKLIDLSHLGWGIDKFPACMLPPDFMGGSEPVGNCNPVELTIRHAFRRVVDTDFEPQEWDGYRFQAYGAFTSERSGYSRNYGMTDDKWHRLQNKYNVWQRSHYYKDADQMKGAIACFVPQSACADKSCVGTPIGASPHRDDDKDGTEDECAAAGKGSRCDTLSQKCTLPYSQRAVRPVVWYHSTGSSPAFFGPTDDAAHEWDVALRAAVQAARQAECVRVAAAADKDNCAAKYPVWKGQMDDAWDAVTLAREVDDCRRGAAYKDRKGNEAACTALADEIGKVRQLSADVIAVARLPEMLVLCHSPVEAGDPALCAPANERLPAGVTAEACFHARQSGDAKLVATCAAARQARKGDLRYHAVNSMVAPQSPSPWGIMVDANDPLTGEVVSASINVWTHVNDLWSQGVVDQARYIAKEITDQQITNGDYIRDWAQAAQAASSNGLLGQWHEHDVGERTDHAFGHAMDDAAAKKFEADHPDAAQLARDLHDKLAGVTASARAGSTTAPTTLARLAAAKGTAFEAKLLTPAVQQWGGILGLPLGQGLFDLVSPLRGAHPALQRELRQLRENALADRGSCVLQMADAPVSVAALSDVLQAKFGSFNPSESKDKQAARAERMQKFLARRAHYGVILHEMGHSIGLRHNFVSSSDAWGYRPQYWQLRTRDATVTKSCDSLVKDGSLCVGPRYYDPVTKEERDNLVWMWMQSSVMDYAGEAAQDLIGLGVYDFAATRMFYGDTVAVHADPTYVVGQKRAKGMLAKMDTFGGILGLQPTYNGSNIHYSLLQKNYELIHSCEPVDANLFKPARWNDDKDGAWSPLLDGLFVSIEGQTTRCRQQPVDYVGWTTLRDAETAETNNQRAGGAIDPQGRVRMPYGFATDRWADLGNASVYRHDNGADSYEIFNFLITQQEIGHIFDNYRRGRHSFSVRAASTRTLARYNEKMRDGAKGLGLYRNIYRDVALEAGQNADELWAYAAKTFYPANTLAAGMVFDHFGRLLARPQPGGHFRDDAGVLRSLDSKMSNAQVATELSIYNGATGFFGNVAFGAKPVENNLADDKGEYNAEYTTNCGSYYDKMYVPMLLTESVDNFISSSLGDFTDARYRAVGMADLFPDAYRRMIGNALTGDEAQKGARVAADDKGKVLLDGTWPKHGVGWTSWIGATPKACFPGDGSTLCGSPEGGLSAPFKAQNIAATVPLDAQIGWEQQKFLIAWTMLYLPENQQQNWLDMLRVYDLGEDASPTLYSKVEFHHPNGKVFVARSYGRETVFGKSVEKGIAARVLEYANSLLVAAYDTTPGPDADGDGAPDWYIPLVNPKTGQVHVKYDPGVQGESPTCTPKANAGCTCASNRACMKLAQYVEVPFYLREAVSAYALGLPKSKGVH